VPHLPVGLMELGFTAVGWIVWGFRSCCLGYETFSADKYGQAIEKEDPKS
jgi:hypothetical protein